MSDRFDDLSFEGVYITQTDLAILFEFDDIGKEWIPKSQIEGIDDEDTLAKGEVCEFVIPRWLAEDKGLE